MAEASLSQATRISLKVPTTHLVDVLSYLLLDTRPQAARSVNKATRVVWTRCTKLEAMVRSTLATRTRPTDRVSKCK